MRIYYGTGFFVVLCQVLLRIKFIIPRDKISYSCKKKNSFSVENSKRRDDVGFRPPRSGGRRAAERRGSGDRPAAQRPGGRRDDVGYTPLGLSLCAL